MKIVEHLNKGVVQTRDPGILKPGELQTAANTLLRPADPALHRAFGRTAYGTVAVTPVATCTTDASTSITTAATFSQVETSAVLVEDSHIITAGTTWTGTPAIGQSVWGVNIPVGTRIRRIIDSTNFEIDQVITGGVTTTIYISDIHVGTYIAGGSVVTGTKVVTVDNATTITMSATAPVNANFTANFGEKIDGLKNLTFDGGLNDVLVAKADHKLYKSALTAVTGTFAEIEAGMSHNDEAGLEAINIENRHVLLTGADLPRVIYYKDDDSGDVTADDRALGMLPVTAEAFIGVGIASASWPDDALFKEGDYYFLVTEVMKINDGTTIEGTYDGESKKVTITDVTSQGVIVEYTTTPVNDGLYGRNLATHWRVYMGPRVDNDTERPAISTFVRVAEVDINTSTITLGNVNPFRPGYPDKILTPAGFAVMFPGGTTNVISGQATQTVASCTFSASSPTINSGAGFGTVEVGMYVFSPDNDIPHGCRVINKASSSVITVEPLTSAANGGVTLTFGNANVIDNKFETCPTNPNSVNYRAAYFHSFGLGDTIGNFSGATISGVEVELVGRFETDLEIDPGFEISLFKGGSSGTQSDKKWGRFITLNRKREGGFGDNKRIASGESTIKFGTPTDAWNMSGGFASTDFADSADGSDFFGVLIKKRAIPSVSAATYADHRIDGIKVIVHAGTSEITLNGEFFPTITISDQLGAATDIPKNGPPPKASTGDVFNGVLMLNDVSRPSEIAGSAPLEYEAFPSVYRIPIQSKDNDEITVIRRLGKVCIIGMKNSVKRLNYFPLDTDADFNSGRAYEDVATDHGIVGPQAATLLDLPGRGTVLAYLSHRGVYWTDGITSTPLNTDIDWENLFDNTKIQRSTLVVYPRLYLLVLYYWASGAAYKAKALYFSYHPTHIKEGGELPACGPNDVRAESACYPLISGVSYLFTGHSLDGKVYREDDGSIADENSVRPDMTIRTRRLYHGRFGNQGRLNNIHLLVDAAGNATTGPFNANLYYQEEGKAVTADTENPYVEDTIVGGIINLWGETFGDAFDFEITKDNTTAASFRLHLIGFETKDYKLSTSN